MYRKNIDEMIEEYETKEVIIRKYTPEEFDRHISNLDTAIKTFDGVKLANQILLIKQAKLDELQSAKTEMGV